MAQHLRLVTFSQHFFFLMESVKVWTFSFVEVSEHVMFDERAFFFYHPGHIEAEPHFVVWFHRNK